MEINIPPGVKNILAVLHRHGAEAYIVGGCVRDSILGKKPQDWDITTSASPHQVKSFFAKTIDTGIKHGTVTVLYKKEAIEVTTFRVDGVYEDHRHPKQVSFTQSLKEDVARRDFTVNAMAYSPQTGIIDYFGGQEDLKDGLIRCVGQAAERFEEDALRMMRAIRFGAVLNFQIEEATAQAIRVKKSLIQAVSQERIRIELVKTIESSHPEYIAYFVQYGLFSYFLPELTLSPDPANELYQALAKLPANGLSRLAYLFQNLGPQAEGLQQVPKILRRMTFDKRTIDLITKVSLHRDLIFKKEDYFFRKILSQLGPDITMILLEIGAAEGRLRLSEMVVYLKRAQKYPLRLADLAVNGRDLMLEGITEGREIGKCLNDLLEIVLAHPQKNKREDLIQILHKNKS